MMVQGRELISQGRWFERKLRSWFLPSVIAVFTVQALASSDDPWGALDKAESAYDQEQYEEAIKSYEEMIAAEIYVGDIFFNLGNAYFRSGKTGEAMAAYLGALHLSPRDPDVKANIRLLLRQIKDRFEIAEDDFQGSVFGTPWKNNLSPKEMTLLCLVLWFLAACVFALGFWRPGLRLRSVCFLPIFGIGVVATAGCFWVAKDDKSWAAVTADQVSVRSGPGEQNPALFVANTGTPVSLKRHEGAWCLVELPDGKKGWLQESQFRAHSIPWFAGS